jgi:hypothetical protein
MTDTRSYPILLQAIREVLTDEQRALYQTNAFFRASIDQTPYTILLLVEGSEHKSKRTAERVKERQQATMLEQRQ